MITIEAIATAVFGAVLGLMLGLGLGIALQRGLESQGLRTLSIPWGLLEALRQAHDAAPHRLKTASRRENADTGAAILRASAPPRLRASAL